MSVFNLLPRLIELTPKIFASQEWVERIFAGVPTRSGGRVGR